MKTSINSILCILVLGIVIIASGCRKDRFEDEIINNKPDPSVNLVVDIHGIMLDKSNLPIENVQIKVGDRMGQSDENGVFVLRQTKVNDAGSRFKAEKNGYFDAYRIIYPHKSDEKIFIELQLTEKGDPIKFQSDQGDQVVFNNNAKVDFPANAIVDEAGNVYNGSVSVYAHWYDPTDLRLATNSPANLEGVDASGNNVVLSTYGMMAVELESDSGQKLQIGNDQLATLSFPIPASLMDQAPNSIPLWSVDNATGKWVEEFSAKKEGMEYVGSVNHFSFWNCDVPNDFIQLEGYLKTSDGAPIANKAITLTEGSANSAVGYTNNVGYFEGKVPNDALLTMRVSSCDELVFEEEIGPFSTDTDMGDVIVDILIASTNISASLKGCVGETLTGAYAILGTNQLLSADSNGDIFAVYTACTNVEHKVKFYDGLNQNVSDELNIDLSSSENNYGNVTVCEQLGEFISFSVDGGDYWLIEDPESYIINGNKITLVGKNTGIGYTFKTSFPGATVGDYNPSETIASLPPDSENPNGLYLQCTDNENVNFICDQFTVNLLEVDMTNELVSGTFEGYLLSSADGSPMNQELFVTGSFRSKITEQFNEATINGRVWVDLNENGTRDGADEDDACVNVLRITRVNETGQVDLGTVQAYPDGNAYTFTGIRPGNYMLTLYDANYEVTDYQVGDPTKDNDFKDSDSFGFETEIFYIGDGEVMNNIDIGFKPPSHVNAFMYGFGCVPDLQIQCVISGGMKPYSIELSDGQSEVVDGTVQLTVAEGGTYELTVTDALNNSTTTSVEVFSYNNMIAGFLWEDKDGGTEGFYDTDSDSPISSAIVTIYDSNDQFVGETNINSSGGYVFRNMEPGDYYIVPQIPVGMEISDLNGDEFYGNDIDPSTEQSPIFTITDCNESVRINAAFKAL